MTLGEEPVDLEQVGAMVEAYAPVLFDKAYSQDVNTDDFAVAMSLAAACGMALANVEALETARTGEPPKPDERAHMMAKYATLILFSVLTGFELYGTSGRLNG